jgi:hypothetical protein
MVDISENSDIQGTEMPKSEKQFKQLFALVKFFPP